MKKMVTIRRILISLLLAMGFIAGFSVVFVPSGYAQTPEPTPGPMLIATPAASPVVPAEPATSTTGITDPATASPLAITTTTAVSTTVTELGPTDEIGFAQLGFTEEILRGPSDSLRFRFDLPANWELTEGAALRLRVKTYAAGLEVKPTTNFTETLLGTLDISLNDIPLRTVSLDERAERTVTIPITLTALIPNRTDGRYELTISLDSRISHEYGIQSRLTILPDSSFVLPHRVTTPPTDLTFLPRPIYQGSFLSDTAVIVVPSQPSAGELQAALAVAAGFGRLTDGKLILSLKPVNRLTPEIQADNHLIWVGKPASFSLLKELELPAPVSGAGFKTEGLAPGDGVIQMAVSPWNEAKVVLIISGDSDEAVQKAGQAISSGKIRAGTQPNLALVAKVQPDDFVPASFSGDRNFSQLGYAVETLGDQGVWGADFFYVPPGDFPGDEAYLDLVFNHSALLDYRGSTLTIRLNDNPIGAVRLSDESTSPTTVRLPISPMAMHSGDNRLEIRADLQPATSRGDLSLEEVWLTIWPESSLHLPLNEDNGALRQVFDLSKYPVPFTHDVTLGSTAFILTLKDATAWDVAARIAFDLANRAETPVAEFTVVTDEDIPEEVRQTHHLLIIGRPSQLPLITELSDALPAPFEAGNDIATERTMRVVYRTPKNSNLGYLELLPAPWNPSLNILAVLGNSDVGLSSAGALLTERESGRNIQGNFLVVANEQIVTGDRLVNLAGQNPAVAATVEATAVQSSSPNQATTLTGGEAQEPVSGPLDPADETLTPTGGVAENLVSQLAASQVQRPAWILPLLGVSTALMLMIVVVVLISGWRRRRSV